MSSMLNLFRVEVERALRRRAVWGLIALFLAFAVASGTISYVDSMNTPLAELQDGYPHGAVMTDWWIAGTESGILMTAAAIMMVGALLGGATVAGAEWRAGTITTVLTWEPRRRRLQAARTAAAVVLAVPIALALLVVFLALLLPAALVNGTTAGTDSTWWWSVAGAVTRISLMAGLAAMLGISLATLGRNTTFAPALIAGWMLAGENLIRGLWPSQQHHLIGENLTAFVTWAPVPTTEAAHSAATAAALLTLYTVVGVIAATVVFARRDIAKG